MSRSTDQVLDELLAIDLGGALPDDPGSFWALHLTPLADAISTAEARYDTMFPQVDPRNATDFLEDFERVLGPDVLGRDLGAPSIGQRQQLAYQRWTYAGGCSPNFYIGMAAALGIAISIATFTDYPTGNSVCGDPLAPEGDLLTWQITMPATLVVEAITGFCECGDPLGWFTSDQLAALIALTAQPHTLPIFVLE